MKPGTDHEAIAPDPEGLERLGDLLGEGYADGARAAAPRASRPVSQEVESDPARRLAAVWDEVVGEEAATNSRPRRLKQGKLTASASSTAWAQTLQFLAETIEARLNERLGSQVVKQVVFHHAGWEEIPRGVAPEKTNDEASGNRGISDTADTACTTAVSRVPGETSQSGPSPNSCSVDPHAQTTLSKEQQEALANVEAMSLEPELKERIVRAMRAAFVRDQWDSVR